ncbi:MAG TPA: LysM peptidoglycan-binding domain-containing protein [Anaerolineales bacterium]|nr:LysM peptidoglycan-binding domain-containing protein [Anaerolineales bacterium]
MSLKPRLLFPLSLLIIVGLIASACQPQPGAAVLVVQATEASVTEPPTPLPEATPFPTRPPYQPGEMVDYLAQTGDTLPGLAAHFNTSIEEILEANPIIPQDATTMPPGMPMKIPIYYAPLWGSPFQIVPDSQFVNGPAGVNFDTQAFIDEHPGWLKDHVEYAADATRRGGNIVDDVALNFSVSPRLLLALLEYQSGALSNPERPENAAAYALGKEDREYRGLYMQLVWAANTLNNAYYPYRSGELNSLILSDGSLQRPDPWQNAATVALQKYYSILGSPEEFTHATGPDGLARSFRELFGDPWAVDQPHIPGSLRQPDFVFPFEVGTTWALTGGPHTGWGTGEPYAALDFAPPSIRGGCVDTGEWVTAVAPGVVARSEEGIVVLDLDGDGDERTGWVVFHLHVATKDRAPLGKSVQTGDPLGHPSCERGKSTGTHVHLARKYNGEWLLAQGTLGFNLEGWVAHNGSVEYQGTMTRFGQTVTACVCSNAASFLTAGERK